MLAGIIGFVMTIFLALVMDIPPSYLLGVLCPTPFIVGWILRSFHIAGFSGWGIGVFVIYNAFANAIWYMIVAEAMRLLFQKLRSR